MRLLFLGLSLLALVFILSGCQGFMEDYNCNPVGGMPLNSNQ
jgi:protein involved in sex pheromone biosynthesis